MYWIILIPVLPYFLTVMLISVALIRSEKYSHANYKSIRVSVIVACRNEARVLKFLLDDLFAQDYQPGLFQVIVVDDNSNDSTQELLNSYNDRPNLKILRNSGDGKKSALRTGIEASESEFIITTDADCRMGKKWVTSIVSFYHETDSVMIIAPVNLEEKNSKFFFRFQELEFLGLQGITAGTASMGNPVMCNGANLAFKRDLYFQNAWNLHDEIGSGDDMFLLHSIKKGNSSRIKFLDSDNAAVITGLSNTISEFLSQRARWLSKAGHYTDWFTIYLGIVTFVTISIQLFLMAVCIFNRSFLIILVIAFLMKSVPDIILLYESARRRRRKGLLKWFIPSQVVYPFYVIIVAVAAILRKDKW